MKKILIIGGGAAGMMTAATLAESSVQAEITLIERNPRLGQKVIISGGGRCNVTTGVEDLKEVLNAYPRGARFLRTPFYEFPPTAMREWVEAHGVPLKKEEDQRVFPRSNNGTDVVKIFEKILKDSQVKVMTKRVVTEIQKKENFEVRLNTGEVIEPDLLVLTPGGQAYRHTGSKGDGYAFAEALGHHITPLAPSLSAYVLEEKWCRELAGVSFEKVKIRFIGQEKYEFTGPIMFTHKGVTGPAVFALSALSAFEVLPSPIEIDFLPNQNQDEFRAALQKQMQESPKKQFHNTVHQWVPRSFADLVCGKLNIPNDRLNHDLSKKDLNRCVQFLKQCPLTAVKRSPGDEFVTAGGVDLHEIDSKTLESKLVPGLYFAGEILNIDGFTGGYNLHAAWATGRAVGMAIMQRFTLRAHLRT